METLFKAKVISELPSPLHPQLLGLSMATMVVVIHFGDHFTVIGHASLERNPYETLRYWGK